MEQQKGRLAIPMDRWVQQRQSRLKPTAVLHASLELTERCNLRCRHCYINQPAGDEGVRRREMSLSEWQRILDQMAESSILWLLVTGGEPLLRPDFVEFYLYAKRKGFFISLFTNGTLLTPDLADLLAEYPPWELEITLYGATEATYESITGVPGSYGRCRRGIDLLRERGVRVGLKTVVLKWNVSELDAIRRLSKELTGSFRYDPVVQSRLDGDPRPLDGRLSPEEIVNLEWSDAERVQDWKKFCDHNTPDHSATGLFVCGAGLSTLHVDSYGNLFPCAMARWLRYDLRNGTLPEALRDFLPAVRRLPLAHNRTCRGCPLYLVCQNCPAWAYRETGDPEGRDPFRCHLAHLRAQRLASLAPEQRAVELVE